MLSSVLRSPRAVSMYIEIIQIMRAFVRPREMLASHEQLKGRNRVLSSFRGFRESEHLTARRR